MLTSTYESFNFMFNFYNRRNLVVTPAFRFKPTNNYCRCVGKFTRKDDNSVFFELIADNPNCNTYCAFQCRSAEWRSNHHLLLNSKIERTFNYKYEFEEAKFIAYIIPSTNLLHLFNKHVKRIINKSLHMVIVRNIADLLQFKTCVKNIDLLTVNVMINTLIQM